MGIRNDEMRNRGPASIFHLELSFDRARVPITRASKFLFILLPYSFLIQESREGNDAPYHEESLEYLPLHGLEQSV